jgi:hypothetical protein
MLARVSLVALIVGVTGSHVAAVDGDKAMYVGGTISVLKEKTEGKLITTSESEIVFQGGGKGSLTVPYTAISELEYGQKAGRRVAVAVMVSPLALFSKKRNHYLTVTYKDNDGKEQAGVFELGKDIVRTTLKVLEVRSGKEVTFQDAEACQQYKTPKECQAK